MLNSNEEKQTGDEIEINETENLLKINEPNYKIKTRDKELCFSKELLQYACENFSSLSNVIELPKVDAEDVKSCFKFYRPWLINRSSTTDFISELNLDKTLVICNALGLKSLKEDLEKYLCKMFKNKKELHDYLLPYLNVTSKFDLDSPLATFMNQKFCFTSGQSLDTESFNALFSSSLVPVPIKYELLKNSINKFVEILKDDCSNKKTQNITTNPPSFSNLTSRTSHVFSTPIQLHQCIGARHHLENDCIWTFLDQVFYDGSAIDLSPKNRRIYLDKTSKPDETYIFIGKMTSSEINSEDHITLIVEDRKIYVSAFMLVDNSPVFRAMLQTKIFKEGQTKTINLPGKSLNAIVYFLEFIQNSSKKLNFDTDITSIASLAQEYQVDWLSRAIKTFLLEVKTTKLELQLVYLMVAKSMGFGSDVEKNLINQINVPFPKIRKSPLFVLFDCKVQIMIAQKRLDDILLKSNLNNSDRNELLYNNEIGLLYCLREHMSPSSKPFAVNYNGYNYKFVDWNCQFFINVIFRFSGEFKL